MAGLAGFEPAPHVVVVGVVEPSCQKSCHFHKGIEGYWGGARGVLVYLIK